MRKTMLLGLCVVFAAAALAVAEDRDGGGRDVLSFQTMVAVSGPYVGTANPIRGVPGGGFPWVLKRASGDLDRDGHIRVQVRGLVLADDPSVPENLRLTNPVASFKAIVSCRTIDSQGNPAVVNVTTQDFPASTGGDAFIRDQVTLPPGCVAPIVFVASPGGAWFSATGF
jgi:hypothetical protein